MADKITSAEQARQTNLMAARMFIQQESINRMLNAEPELVLSELRFLRELGAAFDGVSCAPVSFGGAANLGKGDC